ncbi:hypothetical protein KIW84_070116 [Lathyrus oleraceus]|uniref:Uncharacterized protein n=1 Tax=Pisum sativum TaxID=3888 RepID=A0A9D4VFD9_PEA|nr:hypothetical protein KIW84_070116 [Pisum sativum]
MKKWNGVTNGLSVLPAGDDAEDDDGYVQDNKPHETAKSVPVFGLEKAVPSKEGGPDAPPVNFDTNQNVFKSGGSISFTTVAGSTGSMQKVRESDGGDAETNTNTGFSVRTSELAVSSAAPASLSTPPNSNFSNSSSSLSAIGGISATTASTGVSMATSSTPVMTTSTSTWLNAWLHTIPCQNLQSSNNQQQGNGLQEFSSSSFTMW